MLEKIQLVQRYLKASGYSGWLLYDFERTNPWACKFLEIPPEAHLTRRLFYWIPQEGEPVAIIHAIETHLYAHLPGKKKVYSSWKELQSYLEHLLQGAKSVAMEYSPKGMIPMISKVEGGVIDLVRSFGAEIVSSGSFLQAFTALFTEKNLQTHLEAAEILDGIAEGTWKWIAAHLKEGKALTEYAVQQFIADKIASQGCLSEGLPICAVGKNAALAHYSPTKEGSSLITPGQVVLIDLWCKKKEVGSVYADITRMAVVASKPTPRQQHIFEVVRKAQKSVTDGIAKRLAEGKLMKGYEADLLSRSVMDDAGFGPYFVHRTGHNIHVDVHGPGANLDSYETWDDRELMVGTCFSVEPGIYIPGEMGVRLEHDVYIQEGGNLLLTGGVQEAFVCLGDLAEKSF